MNILFSVHWVLFAAIWYIGNGVLHDIFVVINHKCGYDRELLRLLMDGHLLIVSGMITFVCYLMLLSKIQCGALIGIIVAISMLIYCLMIYPFLKSFVTMGISLMVIVVSIRLYLKFPNIYQIMQNYK
jgi:hypothetical protein